VASGGPNPGDSAGRGDPGDPDAEDARLRAAIEAISDPARMREAQALVARAAPELQRVLAAALNDGGWFDTAHGAAAQEAAAAATIEERLQAVRTLCAEETRLGMLVGVAIGFELARELHPDSATGTLGFDSHPDPED
jgi:hypothetical protein